MGSAAPQRFVCRRLNQPDIEAIYGACTWQAGHEGACVLKRARRMALRELSTGCGLGLPPRYVTTVVVQPSDAERSLYDAVLQLLRDHAQNGSTRLAASTLLLEAGSSAAALCATLDRIASGSKHSPEFTRRAAELAREAAGLPGCAKTQALLSIVRGHGDQVLVFTRYRHTLAFASQALREAGVPHVVFHGGLTSAEKRDAFEAFRGGSRVMVATDVGGEGQNLQFCHLLVNFDLPWNPMTVEQRIGRLHRMGQQCEVRVFNLCSAGTIEQRILAVIDQRLHLFELVVGEMDLVLGNLTDDRDLEERLLQVCARDDDAVAAELERVAGEIERARGRFEQTRTFDAALFGRDFEA